MKEIVFVLPFAGGSSRSFHSWCGITAYQFVFIDMPGKGKRDGEPLLNHFEEMLEAGFAQISDYIKNNRLSAYYIWGHSMGSYLAYEIVQRLSYENIVRPKYLIMSATVPPEYVDYERIKGIVADEQRFLDYIVAFGLVPPKVINSQFYRKRYLPQIRRDYEAMLEYRECSPILYNQKTIILNGKEDDLAKEDVRKWEKHFDRMPEFKWFHGGHFFIFEYYDMVFKELASMLKE